MKTTPHITLFGFGVRFELFFWLMMLFTGLRFGEDNLGRAALWIGLVTVSVLIHEFGHAFAYRYYGAKARIAMTGFGGLTYGTEAGHLTPKQKIVVSLAGSTVEMVLLGVPAWVARSIWEPAFGSWGDLTLTWLIWINITWALVNLAPVWPMDGGQIVEQVFILRSGHNRMRLVHKVSIVCGVVAALICWNYGVRFGTWLFIFFIVLNLFGMQLFKTKKPYQLWPGVDTANGTRRDWEDHLVSRPMTNKEHLQSGYTALASERAHDTDRHLAQIDSKRDRQMGTELAVWRDLSVGRTKAAESRFTDLTKPTATLSAVMALHRNYDDKAVGQLTDAIVTESSHPASEQGILWAARNGFIVQIVDRLLRRDLPTALGHAVRIEAILDSAGLEEDRKKVDALI